MNFNVLDKQVNITIPSWAKRIGVMVSGGLDSALMLYLLLKEIKSTESSVQLTVYNVPNVRDNAITHSKNVVNFLENLFDTKINLVNVGENNLPHNQIIMAGAKYIIENKLVDVLYSGSNQNPPVTLPAQGPWRRNPHDHIPEHLAFPFIHLYKTHIVDMYKQFDLMPLAYVTHSCTETLEGRCGTCFQCYERAWAFQEIRKLYRKNNIVPVRFMHNTGGSFLSSWITHANLNRKMERRFSPHGNAHDVFQEARLFGSNVKLDSLEQVVGLLSIVKNNTTYVFAHIKDIEPMLESFDQLINIYYDPQDSEYLSYISIGKFIIDDIKQVPTKRRQEIIQGQISDISKHFVFCNDRKVLNLHWKSQIFDTDPHQLAETLGKFTGIAVDNFDIESFVYWQELTKSGVERVKQLLNNRLSPV